MARESIASWDLTDLYDGMDDPRLTIDQDSLLRRAEGFATRFRGKINDPGLTPGTLLEALQTYESILQESDKPISYASLLFSADTGDPQRGAFLQAMRQWRSEISVRLIFFELELVAIPNDRMTALLADPLLAPYKHYVEAERLFRDYRMSEPEEKILEEKANTGRRAFTRLFEEITAGMQFHLVRDGVEEHLNLSQVLALLREPEREVRKLAAESLTRGLKENSRNLTYIFNTLILDKATDDRLRGYEYPEQERNLANELDPETVELVVRTATDNYPLVSRYYHLKREILGCDRLTHYDRYAPLFETKQEVPFHHAQEIVLSSFGEFSPVLRDLARDFFERNWIDADVRPGKRGGAFCAYITPDLHPYVFVNYLNRMSDVMTLGHELGHAVHARLGSIHSYLNFSPVLPVAELASTFGEMLVFEALQQEASREDKLALYAEKIEGAFATIFRQASMYRFEQAIHRLRREKGELSTDEYCAVWQNRQQEMFGDSLELGDDHKYWWLYIPHFINTPFYVYAYTFGELLVMALYAMYKREGQPFVGKYIELLRAGGSTTPADMLARVGIDIHDPDFWQGGVEVLAGLVDRFEALYRDNKSGGVR